MSEQEMKKNIVDVDINNLTPEEFEQHLNDIENASEEELFELYLD